MQWIQDYQLFLFDFDGLLVNTEEIHFQAYQNMCEKYGFKLDWSFARYCRAAHYRAEGLKEEIYKALPGLYQEQPNWDVLYAYKREQVIHLLESGAVQLMPGVIELLTVLQKDNIKRCVVTHSPHTLVEVVRRQHKILDTIPHWITREHYSQPKPHPEGYQLAIQKFSSAQDKVIGFEDTPRGIEALLQTSAKPVLISQAVYDDVPKHVERYPSFSAITR
jgi:beta-phosphoglucomutase